MPLDPESATELPAAGFNTAAPVAAWLEDSTGGIHPILGVFRIGRSSKSDLCVDSPNVSRHHALLDPQGRHSMKIFDLESRNGTIVNGRKIAASAALCDGDEIVIGAERFVFHQVGSPCQEEKPRETVGDVTLSSERRVSCFLLLGDLRGFSKLAQTTPPGELTEILGKWLLSCKGVVERRRGAIDKYLGDGFLAYWHGDPESVEALAAAVAEFRELPNKGTPGFRIVVHYAEILFGAAHTRSESILPGSEVNFIFRLEKAASQLGLDFCFSAPARDRLAPALPLQAVPGAHALKDFSGEHHFFQPL